MRHVFVNISRKSALLIITVFSGTMASTGQEVTTLKELFPDRNKSESESSAMIASYTDLVAGSEYYAANTEANKYTYNYFPDYPMSLGRGISPRKLQEAKFSIFEKFKRDTLDGRSPISTSADIYLATSRDELKKIFDLDVKLSIRSLTYAGNAALNIVNTYTFDQNNILIIIKGTSEFSRIALTNLVIDKDVQDRLKKVRGPAFQELYGSYLTAIERRGTSIYFLITINNVSTTTKNTINASLNASAKFGAIKGKLESQIRQELIQKSGKEDLNITFYSTGGGGMGDFASIIDSLKKMENSFEGIRRQIANLLKGTGTFEKSVPIGYLITPMSNVPLINDLQFTDPFNLLQEKYLAAVYERYQNNRRLLEILRGVISQTHPISWYVDTTDLRSIEGGVKLLSEFDERCKLLHSELLYHFDDFKSEEEIQQKLIFFKPAAQEKLNKVLALLESKRLSVISDNKTYTIRGSGIKSIRFFIQQEKNIFETGDDKVDETGDNKTDENFYEIVNNETLSSTADIKPAEIMGRLPSAQFAISSLEVLLDTSAKGLRDKNEKFKETLKNHKYFSLSLVITSLFGKNITLPIGFVLYGDTSGKFIIKLRENLKYNSDFL